MQTLIIGLGNELLGDEGVGVHAARVLQRAGLPENVQVIEVGTAILDYLEYLENAERIIIIDAMKGDGLPGTVYRIPLADCQGQACIASMHGFDLFRVMALAGTPVTPSATVFGVEPENVKWSLELSPAVSEAMSFLVEAVRRESRSIPAGQSGDGITISC